MLFSKALGELSCAVFLGDGGVEGFGCFLGDGGVDGFLEDDLLSSNGGVRFVVCATLPTGLSTIVRRFGVLTVVFFLSKLTVLKRVRSIDSRGELRFLLNEPRSFSLSSNQHHEVN